MFEFGVKVRIECPDLLMAATALASVAKQVCVGQSANQEQPAAQTIAPVASVTPAPTAPVAPIQVTPVAPIPAAPVIPAQAAPVADKPAAPAAPVPISTAPTFTVEQVGKAGADLIAAQPGKMQELWALLAQYKVPAITSLTPEQLGPFATALRGMGAKI